MATVNRKVKNAKVHEYSGIVFRSKTEMDIYRRLLDLGIVPQYEKDKIILLDGFKPELPWFLDGKVMKTKVRDMTYTPDFKFIYNGFTVYLEVKGFETDRFPLKRKLFLDKIKGDVNTVFAEVKSLSGLRKTLEAINELNNRKGSA